ncbi:MAG: Hsp20/alpha crystallin family protein, partial [Bacillota bacterium]
MFDLVPFEGRNSGLPRKSRNLFDIDSIFENFFNDTLFPAFYNQSGQMRVDIRENEKEFIVEAELPGVNKEDIHIDCTEDRLTITVQKTESTEEQKDNYIRKERKASSMARSFAIANIRHEEIAAKYENGLL